MGVIRRDIVERLARTDLTAEQLAGWVGGVDVTNDEIAEIYLTRERLRDVQEVANAAEPAVREPLSQIAAQPRESLGRRAWTAVRHFFAVLLAPFQIAFAALANLFAE